MATLEDKILGEKTHYYCDSDSEHEEEEGDEAEAAGPEPAASSSAPPAPVSQPNSRTANTGPKGVLEDWQKFKKDQAKRKMVIDKESAALIHQLSMACRTALDEENDPELTEIWCDEFLKEYRKKRIQQMLSKASNSPKFGSLINLNTAQEFLDAVDKEVKTVKVVVHIEDRNTGCQLMNEALQELCKSYPEVKFCKILAAVAGASRNFKMSGTPALLVYQGGNVVGNYVKLTEELGEEFSTSDVENYLIEMGMLQDKSCVPALVQEAD